MTIGCYFVPHDYVDGMSDSRPFIAVYMMASRPLGVIYTGVTNNLPHRAAAHQDGVGSAFTTRHGCTYLVWYECHDSMEVAIHREKQIKRWRRAWKYALIEAENQSWSDISAQLT
jgi:putative endonuclease